MGVGPWACDDDQRGHHCARRLWREFGAGTHCRTTRIMATTQRHGTALPDLLMDYRLLIKRLDLPAGFSPPTRLVHEDIAATAISRIDLEDDVRGSMKAFAHPPHPGGDLPSEVVTAEFDFIDLVWHENEFRERESLTYVLRDHKGGYLGCAYLYPMGRRTRLSDDLLRFDVDVSWWVTPSAYAAGYYEKAYRALRRWLAVEYPFWEGYFSNSEVPGQ